MNDFVSTEADRELIKELDGLYVGQLTAEEMKSFLRCVKDGFLCQKKDKRKSCGEAESIT